MVRTIGAFTAGVVVGWVGRGVLTSRREVLVRTVGFVHVFKESITRFAAEQVEWWQDLIAEARARGDLRKDASRLDEDARAKVVRAA
jgi:hypothetical protein